MNCPISFHKIRIWLVCVVCCVALGLRGTTLQVSLNFLQGGSLEATVELSVPVEAVSVLRALEGSDGAASSSGSDFLMPSEGALSKAIEGLSGVELKECRVSDQGKVSRHRITLFAKDARVLLSSGLVGKALLSSPSKDPSLNLLEVPLPVPGQWTPQRARAARLLLESLGGLEVRLLLQTPNPLLETTGIQDTPRKCHWVLDSTQWFQDKLPEIQASWRN